MICNWPSFEDDDAAIEESKEGRRLHSLSDSNLWPLLLVQFHCHQCWGTFLIHSTVISYRIIAQCKVEQNCKLWVYNYSRAICAQLCPEEISLTLPYSLTVLLSIIVVLSPTPNKELPCQKKYAHLSRPPDSSTLLSSSLSSSLVSLSSSSLGAAGLRDSFFFSTLVFPSRASCRLFW